MRRHRPRPAGSLAMRLFSSTRTRCVPRCCRPAAAADQANCHGAGAAAKADDPARQATIMTDPETANRTYIGPMTPELVEEIIEKVRCAKNINILPRLFTPTVCSLCRYRCSLRPHAACFHARTVGDRSRCIPHTLLQERPDALLPTMGGQTALNLAVTLAEARLPRRTAHAPPAPHRSQRHCPQAVPARAGCDPAMRAAAYAERSVGYTAAADWRACATWRGAHWRQAGGY